jgi:hypothetical protein
MRLRRIGAACAMAVVTAALVAACDKKDPQSTTTAPSGSGGTQQQSANKAKVPSKGKNAITQHAQKGGSGSTKPSKDSATTSEVATDNKKARKEATMDEVDCATLPDNTAECDGTSFYFCDDKKLWVVDCNAEAKNLDMSSGSCFEGDKFIDCLACDKADDGDEVCCNVDNSVCCDHDDCWNGQGN